MLREQETYRDLAPSRAGAKNFRPGLMIGVSLLESDSPRLGLGGMWTVEVGLHQLRDFLAGFG
ncbi:MAG: hypothetical protein ACXWX8_17550, partial [Candidatus Binatia bacterium]